MEILAQAYKAPCNFFYLPLFPLWSLTMMMIWEMTGSSDVCSSKSRCQGWFWDDLWIPFSCRCLQNQLRYQVFSERFPVFPVERDLCLLWMNDIYLPFLGLYLLPILDYGCLFFRHASPPLLEARITSFSPVCPPRHQGSVYSVNIWAFALVFFSTWNVLCRRIPQQFFPSFYLSCWIFRDLPIPHLQCPKFRLGGMPPQRYATPPTIFISTFQIWDSFHRDCRFGPM